MAVYRGNRSKRDILSGVIKPISKSKKLYCNTVEIDYADGTRAIRLHDTDVITYTNGHIVLDSGGWRTSTTKERINRYAEGITIYTEKYIWYIQKQRDHRWLGAKGGMVFYDGITFDQRWNLLTEAKDAGAITKASEKIKREIAQYVKLIDGVDQLPEPSGGDCWMCCLYEVDTGQSLGDITSDTDHLRLHMEDRYLHGSILVNAMREYGYQDRQIGFHYAMDLRETFKRALRKYLYQRLSSTLY